MSKPVSSSTHKAVLVPYEIEDIRNDVKQICALAFIVVVIALAFIVVVIAFSGFAICINNRCNGCYKVGRERY